MSDNAVAAGAKAAHHFPKIVQQRGFASIETLKRAIPTVHAFESGSPARFVNEADAEQATRLALERSAIFVARGARPIGLVVRRARGRSRWGEIQ